MMPPIIRYNAQTLIMSLAAMPVCSWAFWIGAAGTILVGDWRPSIGPFADALVVLGMATTIASTRKMPLMNFVPSYILGVIGIFALHPTAIGVAVVKIAAPSAIGAVAAWLARQALARFASPAPDSVRPKSGPTIDAVDGEHHSRDQWRR